MGIKVENKTQQMDTIKRLRTYLNMSRSEFALYTGIPFESIKNWETGKTAAPEYVINMLEALIGIEVSQNNNKSDNRRLMEYFTNTQKIINN